MCVMQVGGADPGEEILHLARISKQLPVQVTRIPVDQDPAEIKDDCVYLPVRHSDIIAGLKNAGLKRQPPARSQATASPAVRTEAWPPRKPAGQPADHPI